MCLVKKPQRHRRFSKTDDFLNQIVSKTTASDYQTIENNYYLSRPDYELMDQQDYFSSSVTYGNVIELDRTEILNENLYLLKKLK